MATFYALFATRPRPPVVAHVCDDIACRLAGAEAICGGPDAGRRAGRASRHGTAASTWLRSPCLGLCERAPAALFTFAGETPATFAHAPVDAVGVVGRCSRPDRPRRGRARRSPRPAPPQAGQPDSASSAAIGVVDPTSLDDYRAHGGYAALDPRARDRARGGHRRGHRLEARRPRRRRLPDRPQVGRRRRRSPPSRTTSSATPTSPSPARSRTASCWRATRSRSSRR